MRMVQRLDWTEGTAYGVEVKTDLFGGNLLFDRDRPDGTYGTVFNDLGLTNVRYPGGSITEWFFDISNPDATQAWDAERGEMRDLLPLSEFLAWAGSEGHGVNLVIPSAQLMTGADGAQVPKDSAYQDVKAYILDVLSGTYGAARIDAIELGNEYWLGAGLNVEEYARIADVIAVAAQDAIDTFKANGAPEGWVEPDISIQVGQYGQHSTDPGWQQNEYLMNALSDGAAAAIDAVVMHYYTRGTFENLPSYSYVFDRLNSWTAHGRFGDLDTHVTEWSTENWDTEERGLRQASTMIWMMSEMIAQGVDQAHVWPLQQNTDNDLSGNEGQTALTLAGEGMRLISESIPGLVFERRLTFDGGVGYLFEGGGETVVVLTSRSDAAQTLALDLASLDVAGLTVSSSVLSTAGGTNDPDAAPEMTILGDVGAVDGGTLEVSLGAYDVARITFGPRAPAELRGSAGDDRLVDGHAGTLLRGMDGHDTIIGGGGVDTIDAGDGNDLVNAGDGADLVTAGAGDDTVDGGNGRDLVELGTGDDTFREQIGSLSADKVYGGEGRDLIYGRGGDDGLSGDGGDDTIYGGDGRDTVLGLVGNDSLFGGRNNDEMDGGSGNDWIEGGAGADLVAGGSGQDTIMGGTGVDTLRGETGQDQIYGQDGADVLSGGGGDDQLAGGAGNDTLAGGDGNDLLDGGSGADVFVFDRDDGVNQILEFQVHDRIDLRGQGLSFDEIVIEQIGADAYARFAGTQLIFLDLDRALAAEDFLLF